MSYAGNGNTFCYESGRRKCFTVWSVRGGSTISFSMVFITTLQSSFSTRFNTVFSHTVANSVRLQGESKNCVSSKNAIYKEKGDVYGRISAPSKAVCHNNCFKVKILPFCKVQPVFTLGVLALKTFGQNGLLTFLISIISIYWPRDYRRYH